MAERTVRPARPNDAPAMGLVQNDAWRQAYADILPEPVLNSFDPIAFADGWRSALMTTDEAEHRVLVATDDDQVRGFVAVAPSPDTDADPRWRELHAVAVHPESRGHGHGSRLLHAAADGARDSGAQTLVAWIPEVDAKTRRFLEAAGFAADGARRERVTADDGSTTTEIRMTSSLVDDTSDHQ